MNFIRDILPLWCKETFIQGAIFFQTSPWAPCLYSKVNLLFDDKLIHIYCFESNKHTVMDILLHYSLLISTKYRKQICSLVPEVRVRYVNQNYISIYQIVYTTIFMRKSQLKLEV